MFFLYQACNKRSSFWISASLWVIVAKRACRLSNNSLGALAKKMRVI
ncbi:hypothetical protein HBZS_107130 [Helicobacter bizzozeronii CCUG 35545]|nr:hypothetical protein HBZS_107130 [Helicobacter bizzozeronii CCUG 35545]